MKASIDGVVVAEAADADLITIEGNYYFPPVVAERRCAERQRDALHVSVEGCSAVPRRVSWRLQPS